MNKLMNTLVSVVISVYNSEKYIIETIDSILNQTYKNLEIIIIDDGSIDNTKKLVKDKYRNNEIYIQENSHSGNIGKNLNEGISLSKGEYICVCGADDVWESNKLEEQMKYVDKYYCVSTNASIIDTNSQIIADKFYNDINSCKIITLEELLFYNQIIASSVLFKKSIINNCGKFDEVYGNRAEDYYFWLNISQKYQILFISKPLIKYRKHNSNLSNKSIKDIEELSLRTIDIKTKYLNKKDDVGNAALKGIQWEYASLINTCIKYKEYSAAKYHCKNAKSFIEKKLSLKYLKYLVYPLLVPFYKIFNRK